ncbi:MAG: APC family permease [Nevskiaceae bacterium]|nr:MAG: APC family permease [Nevskiaceae bacterium]TBR73726.1 MAG: APC family permease [Nevskiaceae bacterium]
MATAQSLGVADAGLKRHVMPLPEVIAQAVASIAPSAVIAFIPAAIFTTAGGATAYAYVLATILMLLAGYVIASFARLHPTAGSLYIYVNKGLGKNGAYLAGMCIMIASWSISTGALPGFTLYFSQFLVGFGIPAHGLVPNIILTAASAAAACWLTVVGIRISARVSFILEVLSLAVILIMSAFAIAWASSKGMGFDMQQFAPHNVHISGVFEGLVLGILSFVGFASVDALGREARNPRKTIPHAIFWSVFIIGAIYVFTAYSQILVLGGKVGSSADPLTDMVAKIGFPAWYDHLLMLGVSASFFAVIVAPMNLVGRVLYVMGAENVIYGRLGVAHERFQTPHRALIFSAIASVVVVVIFELFGADLMNILVWVDTWGTYGYMLGYLLVSLSAIVYIPRHDPARKWKIWVASVIVIIAMLGTFEANIYPVPAYPLNILPFLFLATLVLALCWYIYLRTKRPEVYAIMGTKHTAELPTGSMLGDAFND